MIRRSLPISVNHWIFILARILIAAFLFSSQGWAAKPRYIVTDTIPVPGDVRWDTLTLDAKHHHLFIAHSDRVDVLNVAKKYLVGSILHTDSAHGIALAPDLHQGFISNGNAGTVTVFDSVTLRSLKTVAVGENPDAILYDTATQRVFAANGNSRDLTVIDATQDDVIGTISLEGEPEFMAADATGHLYVNLVDVAQIAVIDMQQQRIDKRYNLAPECSEPTGIALDQRRQRLFVSCRNNALVVVAADSGEKLATLPIGSRTDGAAFDAALDLAFSSNGDGTLTIVGHTRGDRYTVVQTLKTLLGARTIALDPHSHRIYLATATVDRAAPPMAEAPFQRYRYKPHTFRIVVVSPTKSAFK